MSQEIQSGALYLCHKWKWQIACWLRGTTISSAVHRNVGEIAAHKSYLIFLFHYLDYRRWSFPISKRHWRWVHRWLQSTRWWKNTYMVWSITAAHLYMHPENMFVVLKTFLTHLEIKAGKKWQFAMLIASVCLY